MSKPIAIITGASTGIGRSLSIKLSAQYFVYLISRNKEKLQKIAEIIKKQNKKFQNHKKYFKSTQKNFQNQKNISKAKKIEKISKKKNLG